MYMSQILYSYSSTTTSRKPHTHTNPPYPLEKKPLRNLTNTIMLQLRHAPSLLKTSLITPTAQSHIAIILCELSPARAPRLRKSEPLIQENLIHILQTPPRSLRIEQPSNGYETGIENRPNDVKAVSEVGDGARGDVDDDEV